MGRAHLKHTVYDQNGNVIQNASVFVYEVGTTTPVTDAFNAYSGGGAQALPLTSNAQGEVECWLTTARRVDLSITDNSDAAYYPNDPTGKLSWTAFPEAGIEVYHDPADVTTASHTHTHVSTTGQTADDHHNKVHTHANAGEGGTVAHSATTGQTANDHHTQSHTHASHTGVGPDDHHTQSHSHASHTGVGVNDHHAQAHADAEHTGPNKVEIMDEGVSVSATRSKINFTGAGVTATDDPGNGRVNVAVSGAGVTYGSPTGQVDIGDAQADGASADVPRADHQHAFPAPAAGYPVDISDTEADGAATTVARSDHRHAHSDLSAGTTGHTKTARKTADESVTSSTVLQDEDSLGLAVGASEVWRVTYYLLYDATTTGDLKIGFTGPAAAAFTWGSVAKGSGGWDVPTAAQTPTTMTALAETNGYGGAGAGSTVGLIITGIYVGGGTAGTLTLQFAQNTSDATATKLLTNSVREAVRIA